jgi:hypothetical protein
VLPENPMNLTMLKVKCVSSEEADVHRFDTAFGVLAGVVGAAMMIWYWWVKRFVA